MNPLHPTYASDLEQIIASVGDDVCSAGKRFFITGGSGLVGSCLIDALMLLQRESAADLHIYATFTSEQSCRSRFAHYLSHPHFHPIIQDLCRPLDWEEAVDCIIHGASNTHPRLYAADPLGTARLNLLGSLSMLKLAEKNPSCRTLFLSSYEVYGQRENPLPYHEDEVGSLDFNSTRACYPESKRMCETLFRSAAAAGGTCAMIARLGSIYGPTVKLNSSKADVQFLNCALQRQPIIMKSPGLNKRSWCYVADTIQGILRILASGQAGEAYNVAHSDASLSDFAHTLASIAGVDVICENPNDTPRYELTMSSAKLQALGWQPHFSLISGIRHTYNTLNDTVCSQK